MTKHRAVRLVCLLTLVVLVIAKNVKFKKALDDIRGYMHVKHGAFKCLGALVTAGDILTCCTCVSDVRFTGECPTEDAPNVGYAMKPLDPANVTVTTPEFVLSKSTEVIIHPQCDLDGTYDYAIVRVKKRWTCPDARYTSGGNHVNQVRMYSLNANEISRRLLGKHGGFCQLHTIFDNDPFGKAVMIPTKMTDNHFCWNGSETKKDFATSLYLEPGRICPGYSTWLKIVAIQFRNEHCETRSPFLPMSRLHTSISIIIVREESALTPSCISVDSYKYCIQSVDESPISEAKTGSPVYCDGKLVGILARRFPLGGRSYCTVNGLDGAVEFIKDVLKMTVSRMVSDIYDDYDRMDNRQSDRQPYEKMDNSRQSDRQPYEKIDNRQYKQQQPYEKTKRTFYVT